MYDASGAELVTSIFELRTTLGVIGASSHCLAWYTKQQTATQRTAAFA